MSKPRKNVSLLEDLSSLELAKIGLTFAVIGDIIGYIAILKAEEEERLRAPENQTL
ncbi:hypothetical protein [Paenibacillus sp. JCM 10914]|uniref:hypothetical protein n=1 Tax=Paenibacillus sp. JCM 10914 TaxID=1236974 RepID=UPI0012E29448|nr:hypothetical protein [Paenibacillus sp. JCM 10914]